MLILVEMCSFVYNKMELLFFISRSASSRFHVDRSYVDQASSKHGVADVLCRNQLYFVSKYIKCSN